MHGKRENKQRYYLLGILSAVGCAYKITILWAYSADDKLMMFSYFSWKIKLVLPCCSLFFSPFSIARANLSVFSYVCSILACSLLSVFSSC